MKIKDYICKCGNDKFTFIRKGNQTGIYCDYCGKWYKWASKDEVNLFLATHKKDCLSSIYGKMVR